MNPCPCGYCNHPLQEGSCSAEIVQKYLNKISGPLMDRINLPARAYNIIFKVSRTIAGLDRSLAIQTGHLEEAIQCLSLDRENWVIKKKRSKNLNNGDRITYI
jgi:predicted ATPase with chaperone activity